MKYASNTLVSSDKSKAEIERTLTRYGADHFAYGWNGDNAMIGFRKDERFVRFILPLPDKNNREFTHTPGRDGERHPDNALKAWEQATRQRWRALALVIKAKLEAVESEITTFEEEFLAHIVLPGGRTVGQAFIPQIGEIYKTKKIPSLLEMK